MDSAFLIETMKKLFAVLPLTVFLWALSITIGARGLLAGPPPGAASVGTCEIASTAFSPLTTCPTKAYTGGRLTLEPVTIKNWLPDAPAGAVGPLAIATTPFV